MTAGVSPEPRSATAALGSSWVLQEMRPSLLPFPEIRAVARLKKSSASSVSVWPPVSAQVPFARCHLRSYSEPSQYQSLFATTGVSSRPPTRSIP